MQYTEKRRTSHLKTVVTANRSKKVSLHLYAYLLRVDCNHHQEFMRHVATGMAPILAQFKVSLDLHPYSTGKLRVPYSYSVDSDISVDTRHVFDCLVGYKSGVIDAREAFDRRGQPLIPWGWNEELNCPDVLGLIFALDLNCAGDLVDVMLLKFPGKRPERNYSAVAELVDHELPNEDGASPRCPTHVDMMDRDVYWDFNVVRSELQELVDLYGLQGWETMNYLNSRAGVVGSGFVYFKVMQTHRVDGVDVRVLELMRCPKREVAGIQHNNMHSVVEVRKKSADGKKSTKANVNVLQVWVNSIRSRHYAGVALSPIGPYYAGALDVSQTINTWQGMDGYRLPEPHNVDELLRDPNAPISVILRYHHDALCNGLADLSYMALANFALMFFEPDKSTGRIPVYIGAQGIGKSAWFKFWHRSIFGIAHSGLDNSRRLTDRFNGDMAQKVVHLIDEATITKAQWDALKFLSTAGTTTVESKYVDAKTAYGVHNYAVACNPDSEFFVAGLERRPVFVQSNPELNWRDDREHIEQFVEALEHPDAATQMVWFMKHVLSFRKWDEWRNRYFVGALYVRLWLEHMSPLERWIVDSLNYGYNFTPKTDEEIGYSERMPGDLQWYRKVAARFLLEHVKRSAYTRAGSPITQTTLTSTLTAYGCELCLDFDGTYVLFPQRAVMKANFRAIHPEFRFSGDCDDAGVFNQYWIGPYSKPRDIFELYSDDEKLEHFGARLQGGGDLVGDDGSSTDSTSSR